MGRNVVAVGVASPCCLDRVGRWVSGTVQSDGPDRSVLTFGRNKSLAVRLLQGVEGLKCIQDNHHEGLQQLHWP